jgi:CDP-diglyceride synthetase
MSNLAVRLLTAAVVVPLLLLLLYRGPAWGLYLLILPASLIGTYELLDRKSVV